MFRVNAYAFVSGQFRVHAYSVVLFDGVVVSLDIPVVLLACIDVLAEYNRHAVQQGVVEGIRALTKFLVVSSRFVDALDVFHCVFGESCDLIIQRATIVARSLNLSQRRADSCHCLRSFSSFRRGSATSVTFRSASL